MHLAAYKEGAYFFQLDGFFMKLKKNILFKAKRGLLYTNIDKKWYTTLSVNWYSQMRTRARKNGMASIKKILF